MKVRNPNYPLGEIIDRQGRTHEGDAFGVFNVPSDFGNWLCGTPGWEPEAGASLGSISTKVEEKLAEVDEPTDEDKEAAEAAAREEAEQEREAEEAVERERLEAEQSAEVERLAAVENARADTQERQVIDGKEDPPPPPPPPSLTPDAPPAPPETDGPDLEGKTQPELLVLADEYREQGYAIPEFDKDALKPDIKAALSLALYGEDTPEE